MLWLWYVIVLFVVCYGLVVKFWYVMLCVVVFGCFCVVMLCLCDGVCYVMLCVMFYCYCFAMFCYVPLCDAM